MKLAVLMDPIEQLNPAKDTTLAMMQSAAKLGWSCEFFTQKDIICHSGCLYATMSTIIFNKSETNWCDVKTTGLRQLDEFDIILMRKDPPFNTEYIYSTYALELAEKRGVLVANKPQSLRDVNEKFFLMNFSQCTPPTLVSKNALCLRQFWEEHRQVIFKPLSGMGGRDVFYVDESGKNLSVILEILTQEQQISIMAQSYIPEIITNGDKRIILINGEPIPYALARIPATGELRGNLAAGATGKVVAITERDIWLCSQISPILRDKGLYFVGIDVIGDYLTEINVTSPTCACEITAATGIDITTNYLITLSERCLN